MNRVNFVLGAYPDDIQMNRIQESAENSNMDIVKSAIGRGVASGFDLAITGDKLDIGNGTGYDEYGRILKTTELKQLELSELIRPPSGQVKWITITASYVRNNYGDTYDMANTRHDLFMDDDVEFKFVQGTPAGLGSAVRPEILYDLILADWQIDNTTPFEDLLYNLSRRIIVVPTSRAFFTCRVILSGPGPFDFLLADLNIPAEQYKTYVQMVGKNIWQMPVSIEMITDGIRLHSGYFDGATVKSGTSPVKIGDKTIGEFKIGASSEIITDLFFKLEA